MSPQHHPDDFRLLDYATGAMGPGGRLVIATHLNVCESCRRQVAEAEAMGGALLSTLPRASMRPDALALALARIERPAPAEPTWRDQPDWISVPKEVLRAAQVRRRRAAPGVWVAPVTSGPGRSRSYLLGVAAGMSVPLHTHRGYEMVCVLKGGYEDRGIVHEPGDFTLNDDSVEHRPAVTAEGDCVCLIATEAPLVARDWVGRLFQPIVGI